LFPLGRIGIVAAVLPYFLAYYHVYAAVVVLALASYFGDVMVIKLRVHQYEMILLLLGSLKWDSMAPLDSLPRYANHDDGDAEKSSTMSQKIRDYSFLMIPPLTHYQGVKFAENDSETVVPEVEERLVFHRLEGEDLA